MEVANSLKENVKVSAMWHFTTITKTILKVKEYIFMQ
jgi:hypothetical protein